MFGGSSIMLDVCFCAHCTVVLNEVVDGQLPPNSSNLVIRRLIT